MMQKTQFGRMGRKKFTLWYNKIISFRGGVFNVC